MLEPPIPAGEPFAAQGEEESKTSEADFEKVCISLVERGWKIMPKRGTYPVSKKGGPRYLNLVDPRGNRKSVRVVDENLWEKLRAAEAGRSRKRNDGAGSSKLSEISTELASKAKMNSEPVSQTDEMNLPLTKTETASQESPDTINSTMEVSAPTPSPPPHELLPEMIVTEPHTNAELSVPEGTEICRQIIEPPESRAEVIENPPKEFQNFAFSSPGLQKSIFDLGFETLLTALQGETLMPSEIVQKIQEWSVESNNLLEFVHKWQEKSQPVPVLPETSEKDQLISELQSTLKETENKLAEMLRSLREI